MQSFRNLRVWEKAHRLTLDVYASSKTFPRDENVRSDKSDAARFSVDRDEYCRGLLQEG